MRRVIADAFEAEEIRLDSAEPVTGFATAVEVAMACDAGDTSTSGGGVLARLSRATRGMQSTESAILYKALHGEAKKSG